MGRYISRKFVITSFFAACGTIGWWAGKMSGAEYVALVTLLSSVYGYTNVQAKKFAPED